MRATPVSGCQYCPRWLTVLWLAVGLAAVVLASGCRRGVPVVDTAPKPEHARGTITGTVTGPDGRFPVSGRPVTATNLATGERHTVRTSSTGGFTILAAPGKYRVELQLQSGESLLKAPDVVDLDRADIDSHIAFVVGAARIARPRGPAYRVDNGLGAPIA